MSAKFKPGDVIRSVHAKNDSSPTVVVKFCGDRLLVGEYESGDELSGRVADWELAPRPLPRPYIGYTHGGRHPEGIPGVYPLSMLHSSDAFYDCDVYEVEVRYIRKLDTSRPEGTS